MTKRPFAVLMMLIFITSHSLYAQKEAAPQFSCVVWDKLDLGQIYYLDNEVYKPLKFRKGTRSDLYPLSSDQPLSLYTLKVKDGEMIYKLVGKAARPANTEKMLFLILKNSQASGSRLRVLGMDDSITSFPAGSYKLVNFTKMNLDASIAGTRRRLDASSVKIVSPKISEKGGFEPFYIGDKDKKVIYETRLYSQRRARRLVFIFPETGRRPISVKYLSELIAVEKPRT